MLPEENQNIAPDANEDLVSKAVKLVYMLNSEQLEIALRLALSLEN